MHAGCVCIMSPCLCDQARSGEVTSQGPQRQLVSAPEGSQPPVNRFGAAMAGIKWLAIAVAVMLFLAMFHSARGR